MGESCVLMDKIMFCGMYYAVINSVGKTCACACVSMCVFVFVCMPPSHRRRGATTFFGQNRHHRSDTASSFS